MKALLIIFCVLLAACSYTPKSAKEFPSYKAGDYIQHLDDDNWIYWIAAVTEEGHRYHRAFTDMAYSACKRSNESTSDGCTTLNGTHVFLSPWWRWRKAPPGALTITIKHEECHVDAIQAGREDTCHT